MNPFWFCLSVLACLNLTLPTSLKAEAQKPYHWPIQTQSSEAQKSFDQGMLYFYGFNNAEATKTFRKAIEQDPTCALCHWGVFMSWVPTGDLELSDQMSEEIRLGLEALSFDLPDSKTVSKRDPVEKLLLQAAQSFFPKPLSDKPKEVIEKSSKESSKKSAKTNYKKTLKANVEKKPTSATKPEITFDKRIRLLADAMRKVYQKNPDNTDVGAVFVSILMDISSPNCHSGVKFPLWDTPEIRAVLENVLNLDSHHPGANHFAIHSAEVSPHPERALISGDRLPSLVPDIAHYVHMPSHLFLRLGRYPEAILANQKAIAVDEIYLKANPKQETYYEGFYLHNYYFLWAAAGLNNNLALASATSKQILEKLKLNTNTKMVFLNEIYILTQIFTQLRFELWDQVLEAKPLPFERDYVRAVEHFARGLAWVQKKELAKAQEELREVEKYQSKLPKEDKDGPTRDLSQIGISLLSAEIEDHKGNWELAKAHYQKAISTEEELKYGEPPAWHLPTRDFYAKALLRHSEVKAAIQACEDNLKVFPNQILTLGILEKAKNLLQNKTEEPKTQN